MIRVNRISPTISEIKVLGLGVVRIISQAKFMQTKPQIDHIQVSPLGFNRLKNNHFYLVDGLALCQSWSN